MYWMKVYFQGCEVLLADTAAQPMHWCTLRPNKNLFLPETLTSVFTGTNIQVLEKDRDLREVP